MSYSYHKDILSPFSTQENFQSKQKRLIAKKTCVRCEKKCAKIIPFFNNFFFENHSTDFLTLTVQS